MGPWWRLRTPSRDPHRGVVTDANDGSPGESADATKPLVSPNSPMSPTVFTLHSRQYRQPVCGSGNAERSGGSGVAKCSPLPA